MRYFVIATGFAYAITAMLALGSAKADDMIMSDGKCVEHTRVTPDEMSLLTPADLVTGRDPVLAHAAQELGVGLTPEAAGKLFPYEWPKD